MLPFPKCPFVAPTADVSACPGFAPERQDAAEHGVGARVQAWDTCRHLGAEPGRRPGSFYPACHHPEGPMVVLAGRRLMRSSRT